MHLKKLEIFGFKSFAHKLSLEFGPGITGIVGPNGCGKTNVADAIRWVLGEQSAAELRGSNMADVIFNGTKKRRRLGMAEVTLSIDNTGGYLPTDYSEVVIGRRVFKSGESEYLINKSSCRLRDVKDLFLDTGIGTRTYSLIERKMVDSVLSDSTGHRRFMFEEAAGIMKYKVRKRSTLNKLTATETDMQRVSDIISEVEKQVRSLKRQLAQARRHRRYTDELKDLEIRLGRREYSKWQEKRSEMAERVSRLREIVRSSDDTLKRGEQSSTGVRRELRDKDEALASLEAELAELEGRARSLGETMLVSRERRNASDTRARELETELSDLESGLSLALQRTADLEEEIRSAVELAEQSETTLAEKTNELAKVEKEHRRLRELLAGRKQTRLEGLESSAGLKGELESYRARLDDLMQEHVEIEEALVAARRSLSSKEEQILETLETERRSIEDAKAARATGQRTGERLEKAREELLAAKELTTRLAGELDAARHKIELLKEIRNGYGGFSEGVRALLTDESHEVSGLMGTVADLLDVDPGMAHAVEAALGSAAQYVVTSDAAAARSAMSHLTSGALGRATFIPASELSRVAASRPAGALLEEDGVAGAAASFVKADARCPNLADFLLEGVVVVDDFDTALRLAGRADAGALAFVTREGEMAASGGVMSGGRTGAEDAGLLRRAERLEAAERESASLKVRYAEAQSREAAASRELEDATAAAKTAGERSEETEGQLWEVKRGITELELAKTSLAEQTSQLTARRDALAVRMDATKHDIENLAERLTRLSKGEDELGEQLEGLERSFKETDRARAKAAEEEKQAEIAAATARSALTQLRTELSQLSENARAAQSSIGKKTLERTEHLRVASELEKRIGGDGSAHAKLAEEARALTSERDAMKESAAALRARIEKLDEEARGARESKESNQHELHELELSDTELRGRCEALRERLREDYSIDVAELGDLEPPEDGQEAFDARAARDEVERLKARLRSMGPVNLLALDEYDEESKRLDFLKAQYEDLDKSKASLEEAIRQINETATRMFLETFEEVRGHFIATFQRLFEGGEADLRLLDPADPLESAIEIVASPRGKKLGRLSLLSGGERALTAIALLFAIYLVKPSPFCILDEVDAPLDDANVDRFVRMLREFSSRTQFVIISHNKVTMQAADRLYGITMEESGVSKVVSVKLDGLGREVECEETIHEAV